MSRPKKQREICINPAVYYFKPRGIPARFLEEVKLSWDELEALRLSDQLGLYQEEASANMNISRTTFSRIIESARNKIADAILNGKGIILPQEIPKYIKIYSRKRRMRMNHNCRRMSVSRKIKGEIK